MPKVTVKALSRQLLALLLIMSAVSCGDSDPGASAELAGDTPAQGIADSDKSVSLAPGSEVEKNEDAAAGARQPEESIADTQKIVQLYQQSCIACHAYGAAGAPQTHDVAAWELKMASGQAQVMENILNGINGMPPRGLCGHCSEEELWAITEFMASAGPG